MPDITMCKGIKENGLECPNKVLCYRFTAKASDFYQSYFMEVPFEFGLNGWHCPEFKPDPYHFRDVI